LVDVGAALGLSINILLSAITVIQVITRMLTELFPMRIIPQPAFVVGESTSFASGKSPIQVPTVSDPALRTPPIETIEGPQLA
jgi:hypothetical protein